MKLYITFQILQIQIKTLWTQGHVNAKFWMDSSRTYNYVEYSEKI